MSTIITVPDPLVSASWVLICHPDPDRGSASVEFTRWDTRAEAEQASVKVLPVRAAVHADAHRYADPGDAAAPPGQGLP